MRELTVSNKAIGIDVGSHSLKAVVAVRRGSSVTIKSFLEVRVARSGAADPEQINKAVEDLAGQLRIGSEIVVTSVSTQQATVRNLEIPFSEEEKIRQILKFQTEPYLAFPIEEVIIDFYDTQTAPAGKMKVLLTAIHKGVLGDHLELLSRGQIDPEVVDVDFMAIASTALWAEAGLREKPAIVIDIGSSKSVACYIQEGRLLAVRCLPLGGDDFTEAIQGELGLGFEEAEQIKAGQLAGDNLVQGNSERVTAAIRPVLDRMGAELDRTVRYFSSQVRGGSFDRVILCGGSASLPGLATSLGEALSADVSVLSPPESVKERPGEEIAFPRFATSIGLALRGLGESPCLQNFRQEEHAYARPFRRLRKSLILSGGLVVGIAALLVFSLFDSVARYKAKRSELNFLIQTKRSTIFPGKTASDRRHMEQILEEEKKKLTPFRELRRNVSILAVLADISKRIPKDMKVEVSSFYYIKARPPDLYPVKGRRRGRSTAPTWAGTITLKGTVSSVTDHVTLQGLLKDSQFVAAVEDKGTTPAGGGRVNFDLTLRLRQVDS